VTLAQPKENCLSGLFGTRQPVIGMVHAPALPGAPRFDVGGGMSGVIDFALRDALALTEAGVDGIIIENGGDVPFLKPDEVGHETVAAMAVLVKRIGEETGLPLGVNCLANAVLQSLAIAQAGGALFVRAHEWANAYIANEGFVEGPAGRAVRYRHAIGAGHIRIFADVHVKHGSHSITADRSVSEQASDATFFDADVLIATGLSIGDEPQEDEIAAVRSGSPLPVLLGSGVRADNAERLFRLCDGAIVGSDIKQNGVWWEPVSVERTRRLVEAARTAGDAVTGRR
jgi:membrane complex biogenesis BtpA family protein